MWGVRESIPFNKFIKDSANILLSEKAHTYIVGNFQSIQIISGLIKIVRSMIKLSEYYKLSHN